MKIFHHPINKVSVAQLVAEQKVIGSNLGQGDIFSLKFLLNEELNQMVKNNNDFCLIY